MNSWIRLRRVFSKLLILIDRVWTAAIAVGRNGETRNWPGFITSRIKRDVGSKIKIRGIWSGLIENADDRCQSWANIIPNMLVFIRRTDILGFSKYEQGSEMMKLSESKSGQSQDRAISR